MKNQFRYVHGSRLAKMLLACLFAWAVLGATRAEEGYLTEKNLTDGEIEELAKVLARTGPAVARLAAERQCPNSKKCEGKCCVQKDFGLITLPKNIETEGIELLCRSNSTLTLGWTTNSDESYIIEIVDPTNGHVLPMFAEKSYTFEELQYNKEYYVCLFVFNSFVGTAKSVKCGKFWTLPNKHVPQNVPMIFFDRYIYTDNNESIIGASIRWHPAKDRICFYDMAVWEDGKFFMELESKVPTDHFNATLWDIQYGKNYSMRVTAKYHKSIESEPSWFFFMSGSCFEFTKNPEKCAPASPVFVNATELRKRVSNQNDDMEYYDVKIFWEKPEFFPETYQINITNSLSPTVLSSKTVNGNQTEVTFEDIALEKIYEVSIRAISKGGVSEPSIIFREKKEQANDQRYDDPHSNLLWALLVPILSFIAIAGMSAFIYHRHEKLKLYKRRCRYFEDLEQKAPKEVDNGSSFMIHPENDPFEVIPDKLRLYEILGEGAFGVVRKGWLPDQKREVAVKMLKDEPSAEEVKQFRQEIDMMKAVGSHPHIVSLVGCCTKPSQTMLLVVEFCPCGDLQNYLRAVWDKMASKSSQKIFTSADLEFVQSNNEDKSCPINYAELCPIENNDSNNHVNLQQSNFIVNKLYDLEQTIKEEQNNKCDITSVDLLSFARQIAMGMEFLSLNRVVHRDLAARNVLVCSDKTVKIADFGLSRDIYQENMYKKTGTGKLPIKWMAIESLTRQLYTTQSDVWSYGILLWEIVTLGGNPYPSVPSGRLLKMLMSGYRMECPSNCSQELYSLMMACWQTRPKDRPTFCEIRQRIDSLLDEMCSHTYLTLDILDVKQSYDNAKHIINQFSKNNGFNLGIHEKISPETERYVRPISFTRNKSENHF